MRALHRAALPRGRCWRRGEPRFGAPHDDGVGGKMGARCDCWFTRTWTSVEAQPLEAQNKCDRSALEGSILLLDHNRDPRRCVCKAVALALHRPAVHLKPRAHCIAPLRFAPERELALARSPTLERLVSASRHDHCTAQQPATAQRQSPCHGRTIQWCACAARQSSPRTAWPQCQAAPRRPRNERDAATHRAVWVWGCASPLADWTRCRARVWGWGAGRALRAKNGAKKNCPHLGWCHSVCVGWTLPPRRRRHGHPLTGRERRKRLKNRLGARSIAIDQRGGCVRNRRLTSSPSTVSRSFRRRASQPDDMTANIQLQRRMLERAGEWCARPCSRRGRHASTCPRQTAFFPLPHLSSCARIFARSQWSYRTPRPLL